MAGIRVNPDSVNIVWEVNIKKTVRHVNMRSDLARPTLLTYSDHTACHGLVCSIGGFRITLAQLEKRLR